MDAVVEVIVPNAVQPISAAFSRANQANVVLIALGNDMNKTTRASRFLLDRRLNVGEDMAWTEVEDGVNRVQPQTVHAKITHPHPRVVDDKLPHGIAVRAVVVDGPAPRSAVAIGKVGAVVGKVVSFGTEMVMDHVENHGQPGLVGGVDQPLQRPRPAVAVLHRIRIDGIVTPITVAGKLAIGINSIAVMPSECNCGRRGIIASSVPSGVKAPTCNS